MSDNPDVLSSALRSVLARTQAHLQAEYDIPAEIAPAADQQNPLVLSDMTAIIGFGGSLNMLVAMSFDLPLLRKIFNADTAGLNIQLEEQGQYLQETAAEFANVVLGNCNADLEANGVKIVMLPPGVIQGSRTIRRPDNAVVRHALLTTETGNMGIQFLGPRDLFERQLKDMHEPEAEKTHVSLNVMVVDDSLLSQKKLIAMIEELGHKVVGTADTGERAILMYGKYLPDVVTMDITMPDMDGIQATRLIRQRFTGAKMVMVTSHAQKSMVLDALDAGAAGYIIKPVQRDKLKEAIERAVKIKA